jgi:hypothetical protein
MMLCACHIGAICGLKARPFLLRVQGTIETSRLEGTSCKTGQGRYEVTFPLHITSGGKNSARVEYGGCYFKKPAQVSAGYDFPDCPK